jgi:hypothetical protein
MNTFFFLNCGFSLLIFFVPFSRFTLSPNDFIDASFKAIVFLLIVGFAFVRGRKAIEIKKNYLYCNSYPFYKKFKLSTISSVSLESKKITVMQRDNSVSEVTYFFGIKNAISEEVARKFLMKDLVS